MSSISKQREALLAFAQNEKFVEENLYPGAPDEEIRIRLQGHVNDLAARLTSRLAEPIDKAAVLDEFKVTLAHFEEEDSEERERVCGYLEEIMDIFEIESSDGLLNTWLYGFDPNVIQN